MGSCFLRSETVRCDCFVLSVYLQMRDISSLLVVFLLLVDWGGSQPSVGFVERLFCVVARTPLRTSQTGCVLLPTDQQARAGKLVD
jgi:hypothetical protein